MSEYRTSFISYTEEQKAESGGIGGVMISFTVEEDDEGEGAAEMSISSNRDKDVLDISDMPRFVSPRKDGLVTAEAVSIDFGILLLSILITFAAAFVKFLKYDLR